MQPELACIQDMVNAGKRIARFLTGVDQAAFLADDEKQSSVFGQFVIIGEAANRISSTFQAGHAEIPWRRIVGLRNRIVHGYDDIDWDIVWNTATLQLPELLMQLEALLRDAGASNP